MIYWVNLCAYKFSIIITQNEHPSKQAKPKMSYSLIVYYTIQWLVACMSAEKIISTVINDLPSLTTTEKNKEISSSGRVDINILLNRARKIKEKENKINLVFFGLISALVVITGIILSF